MKYSPAFILAGLLASQTAFALCPDSNALHFIAQGQEQGVITAVANGQNFISSNTAFPGVPANLVPTPEFLNNGVVDSVIFADTQNCYYTYPSQYVEGGQYHLQMVPA